jgi:hypothetical protein
MSLNLTAKVAKTNPLRPQRMSFSGLALLADLS